ncbi:hypothetical protein C6P40_002225, partial [Pichia californica]
MTLKRSFSQKLKTTIVKTKRIVSPNIGSRKSQSSIPYDDDLESTNSSSYSYSYSNSNSDQPDIDNFTIPLNDSYQGLGIVNNNSQNTIKTNNNNYYNSNNSNNNHTPTNSISSIQKSVSHIIS